jgi:hypothetical protein
MAKSLERNELVINEASPIKMIAYYLTLILAMAYSFTFSNKEDTAFSRIYRDKIWYRGSGKGSSPEMTVDYRRVLQQYFDDPKYTTYVDFGCGDWQIMSLITIPDTKQYIGIDVVNSLITAHRERHAKPNVKFYHASEWTPEMTPNADLLIVKDVLQHLSTPRIQEFLTTTLPKFRYALITNDFGENRRQRNILPGEYRPLDLTAPPFNLQLEPIMAFKYAIYDKRTFLWTNPNNVS